MVYFIFSSGAWFERQSLITTSALRLPDATGRRAPGVMRPSSMSASPEFKASHSVYRRGKFDCSEYRDISRQPGIERVDTLFLNHPHH